jgi:hypothetical protein
MTFGDYLIDTVLVLLVVRQIREARFDRKALLLPLVIVGVVAQKYLKTIPTGTNDLLLIGGLALAGLVFGLVSALATRIRLDRGVPLVKAGWLAAGVWVFSMGSRFAFGVWATHGGGPALARFTVAQHLDARVWTAALVLMALAEVVSRTLVLYARARRVAVATAPDAPAKRLTLAA